MTCKRICISRGELPKNHYRVVRIRYWFFLGIRAEYRHIDYEASSGNGEYAIVIVTNALNRAGYSSLADGSLYRHNQRIHAYPKN